MIPKMSWNREARFLEIRILIVLLSAINASVKSTMNPPESYFRRRF